MKAILENTHLLGGKNYQFNLHNALSYHYFGVLEYWDYLPKDDLSLAGLNAANSTKAQQSDSKIYHSKTAEEIQPHEFTGEIAFKAVYYDDGFRILSFTAVKSGSRVKFTLEYESPRRCDFSFFDHPNGDTILKRWTNGIRKGTHKYSWN